MDIPALSMALSQNRLLNDVDVAMLSKSLDTMQENGDVLVAAMDSMPAASELSVNPNIGGNIDLRI
ncbi:MAG: YjfB family protein [Lachnospiraceae bacterium]|nr:YjfB family protein [Lachnospiraceae bacterium]MBR1670729.1 YjfB family protein [Butyrivibrio sp.]